MFLSTYVPMSMASGYTDCSHFKLDFHTRSSISTWPRMSRKKSMSHEKKPGNESTSLQCLVGSSKLTPTAASLPSRTPSWTAKRSDSSSLAASFNTLQSSMTRITRSPIPEGQENTTRRTTGYSSRTQAWVRCRAKQTTSIVTLPSASSMV